MLTCYWFPDVCKPVPDEKGEWIKLSDHSAYIQSNSMYYEEKMKYLDARIEDLEGFLNDVCSVLDVSIGYSPEVPEMIRQLKTEAKCKHLRIPLHIIASICKFELERDPHV